MALDLLAFATTGQIGTGTGGDITVVEVEGFQVVSDDTEYAVVVEDDTITAIVEDTEITAIGDTEIVITIDDDDEFNVQGDC